MTAKEKIMRLLKKRPHTIKELAKELGISIYTCKPACRDLVSDGQADCVPDAASADGRRRVYLLGSGERTAGRVKARCEQAISLLRHRPRTIKELASALGIGYDAAKWICRNLLDDGRAHRVVLDEPAPDGSRCVYRIGTGRPHLGIPESTKPRAPAGPNGGVLHTSDERHWACGSQTHGYGPRAKSAILGE